MRIPSRIHLMGYTITVSLISEDAWQHGDCVGFYDPTRLGIALRSQTAPHALVHTFFHEVTHAILQAMNREDLSRDEAFVDVFGGLLAQIVTTAEYDAPIRRKRSKVRA